MLQRVFLKCLIRRTERSEWHSPCHYNQKAIEDEVTSDNEKSIQWIQGNGSPSVAAVINCSEFLGITGE